MLLLLKDGALGFVGADAAETKGLAAGSSSTGCTPYRSGFYPDTPTQVHRVSHAAVYEAHYVHGTGLSLGGRKQPHNHQDPECESVSMSFTRSRAARQPAVVLTLA